MKLSRVSKRKKGVLVLLLILLALLYNFPFLLYPLGNPYTSIKNSPPIYLDGKALFIADTHFNGNSMDLGTYLASESINHLIIIGDLYNSPQIYNDFGIQATLRLLNLDTYSGQIYFIWGNHDPHVYISTDNLQTLGSRGFFVTAHYWILADHGVHKSRKGSLALLIGYFISYPLLEQLWRKRAGIPEEVWVFTAHSHIAKLDHDLKIATCGGFTDKPLFHPRLGEGILVDNRIQLVTILF
ncbi:MAG: metallophosphoesterase [Candidatus Heimdallarchaeota archaeon]